MEESSSNILRLLVDAENMGQAPENLLWKSVPQVLPEGWTTEEKVLTVGESSSISSEGLWKS